MGIDAKHLFPFAIGQEREEVCGDVKGVVQQDKQKNAEATEGKIERFSPEFQC